MTQLNPLLNLDADEDQLPQKQDNPLLNLDQDDEPQAADSNPLLALDSDTPNVNQPAEEWKGDGILDDAWRGVQTAVAPFSLKKEDFEKPRTWTETAVEVGSNILTDIGTTVGAATAAGAALGPKGAAAGALVGIGMALYRGLGYEYAYSKAKDEDFSVGRAALSTVAEVNPLFQHTNKLGTLTKVGSQALLNAASAKAYGAEDGTAAIAGLVGGGLAGWANKTGITVQDLKKLAVGESVVAKSMTVGDLNSVDDFLQMHGDTVVEFVEDSFKKQGNYVLKFRDELETLSKGGAASGVLKRLALKFEESEVEDLIKGIMETKGVSRAHAEARASEIVINNKLRELATWSLTKAELNVPTKFDRLMDKFKAHLKHQGKTLDGEFGAFQIHKYSVDAIKSGKIKGVDRSQDLSWISQNLAQAQWTARYIEEFSGLPVEMLINQTHKGKIRYQQAAVPFKMRLRQIETKMENSAWSKAKWFDILNDPDWTSKVSKGTTEYNIAQEFTALNADIKSYATKHGLNLAELHKGKGSYGYVHHTTKSFDEIMYDITKGIDAYEGLIKAGQNVLAEGPLNQLRTIIQGLTNETIEDAQEVITRAKGLYNNPTMIKQSKGFRATASFRRKGIIPPALLQQDVVKATDRYINNTLKAAHLGPALDTLAGYGLTLQAAGFEKAGAWVDRYVRDMSGREPAMVAAFAHEAAKRTVKAKRMLDNLQQVGEPTKWQRSQKKFLEEFGIPAGDFLGWSLTQLYPNYLGGSVNGPLRNLTQTIFLTAPEVGGSYGLKLVFKGAMDTTKMSIKAMNELTEKLGINPGKFMGYGDSPGDSPMRGTVLGKVAEAGDWFGEKWMWLYTTSDTINRTVTYNTSKYLVDDLLNGVPQAKEFLRRLPAGYQVPLKRALQARNKKAALDLVAEVLDSRTQFNYGQHTGSQLGRDVGRIGTMFTTWPAMMTSEMVQGFRDQNARMPMLQKLLAPVALLVALDEAASQMEIADHPMKKFLVGRNFKNWAPASALPLFSASPPPAIGMPLKVGESLWHAFSADAKKWEKAGYAAGSALHDLSPSFIHAPLKLFRKASDYYDYRD